MTMRRTTLSAFVALAMTAVMIILLGSPSQAEPKVLLVSDSADGPFRENLATPLFEAVPLDAAADTFYVKNNSNDVAHPMVQVVNRGSVADGEDSLDFEVEVEIGGAVAGGGSIPAPGSPGCSVTVTGPSLAPGAVQAVDVSLGGGDLPRQVGQDQAATLDFVVTLTRTGVSGTIEVCGAQAADPEVGGAQGNANGDSGSNGDADEDVDVAGEDANCERDVVVTVTGRPTCVPTAVDAGATYGAGDPRSPVTIGVLAALLVSTGALTVLLAGRRRRA